MRVNGQLGGANDRISVIGVTGGISIDRVGVSISDAGWYTKTWVDKTTLARVANNTRIPLDAGIRWSPMSNTVNGEEVKIQRHISCDPDGKVDDPENDTGNSLPIPQPWIGLPIIF